MSCNSPDIIETLLENIKNFLNVRMGANMPTTNKMKADNRRKLYLFRSFGNREARDCFVAFFILKPGPLPRFKPAGSPRGGEVYFVYGE
jgi:hypothetical protein